MDIIWTGFAYLLAGMLGLIVLMLILAVFLHCITWLLNGIRIFLLLCISIPAFLFNPRQFIQGYRLGTKYPDTPLETAMFLEKHTSCNHDAE